MCTGTVGLADFSFALQAENVYNNSIKKRTKNRRLAI
jgi:hypothetical protein